MTGDIVLSSAMRTNLSSLQSTQNLINSTQEDLSTGKKVNSALDNPLSYFSSQALNNKASALNNLLDGIGQSIQTIQAANTGVTSLTSLVQQAQSIATQAQSASASGTATATIGGSVDVSKLDLNNISDLSSSAIKLTFTGSNNLSDALSTGSGNVSTSGNVATIDTGTSGAHTIQDVVDSINSLTNSDGKAVAKASLDASGHLQIVSANGDSVGVSFVGNTTTGSLAKSNELSTALGFSSTAQTSGTNTGFTLKSSATIDSTALYSDGAGKTIADRSTLLTNLKDSAGNSLVTETTGTGTGESASFAVNIGINGGASTSVAVNSNTTLQGLIDSINNNSALNGHIQASYDDTTGSIALSAIDSTTTSVEFGSSVTDTYGSGAGTGSSFNFNLGLGTSTGQSGSATGVSGTPATSTSATDSVRFGTSAGDTTSYQASYDKVLDQISSLVKDSGYQGTNLLNGNNLTTKFSADGTSTLTTTGGDFTAQGLGLDQGDFTTAAGIQKSLDAVSSALTTVQNFGSSLSTDLSVMQTRQTFTSSLSSVLTTGSNNLVDADTNEESANLLALQTQQSLGVDALSLASQSQQSVLKLFG